MNREEELRECRQKCMEECINNCPEDKEGYYAELEIDCLMWCEDECDRQCSEVGVR